MHLSVVSDSVAPWARAHQPPSVSAHQGQEATLVVQMAKNLPAMKETGVQSMGWEGPLEKGMAAHSHIHAWRIRWTWEPGGLQSMGSQRVGMTKQPTLSQVRFIRLYQLLPNYSPK